MTKQDVISPAFDALFAEGGPNDKRDAIVVYRPETPAGLPVRGRLRDLKKRLDTIRKKQQALQSGVFDNYFKTAGIQSAKARSDFQGSGIGADTLPVARLEVTRKTLPALAENPDVLAVMPNQAIDLIEPKGVVYERPTRFEKTKGMTWGLDLFEVAKLWETTKGRGVKVAVLDTGVYGDHSALAGRVEAFMVFDPLGRRIVADPSFDGGDHGTHVCGTIAGGKGPDNVSIGVAPEATLIVGGVLIGRGTLLALIAGMSWALEQGADIINMSLGFPVYEPLFPVLLEQLIEVYDVVPVVAIGNEYHGNSSSPGNAHNALSVGALERGARGRLDVAAFSSGASLVFPGDPDHPLVTKPDIVAPGAEVYSCIPPQKVREGTYEYASMDGTSMATPHVSGVCALLRAAEPEARVSDIVEALKETAAYPGDSNLRPDNRWGYGRIRPVEALSALR